MTQLPTPSHLPRWRGFNLLEKYTARSNSPFREQDFDWIAEWGFDFVRLPLSYRCWTQEDDFSNLHEPTLKEIDAAVAMGKSHNIHVNLNFHRAPGYCVNAPAEPLDLWTSEVALDAFARQWAHFAQRYRGIPSSQLSFDLLNEPPHDLAAATYARVVGRLVEAIRAEDPDRLIIADGLAHGNVPVPALVPFRVAQSTRGYAPMRISHHRASWVQESGSLEWDTPQWPLIEGGQRWDKDRLRRERIAPWQRLEQQGVGVHVGEWGTFNQTPHAITLAWMRDCLDLWKEAGWGWALWNFRGAFGVLDSGRPDVQYENWNGHQLDREMLELLQAG